MLRLFQKEEEDGDSDGKTMTLKPGDIVQSTKGRDSDTIYVVVDLLPPRYCLVSDGRKRSVANPKKKSYRHLKLLGHIDSRYFENWGIRDSLKNREIKKALDEFLRTEEGGLH
ncbi:MAG: KOW domain-containing RNA-binding protein [Firmicutes bacterium]|nr:KOW domain-containing RNA-binding protein [Bacillota bacterium]MDD4262993.1 KOW domain-containing RNA-binding protein [Bacillota bacterium]MDD4693358.1 KOW domain-containing RNA-binding protein [Bacillota bacterium]